MKQDNSTYNTSINIESAREQYSPTLLSLIASISSEFDTSLCESLTGNMVTGLVTSKPTMLQVALGVVVREQSTIELLHDFRVTSSYDEVLRFKGSAALAAANDKDLLGLSNNGELIQAVADNLHMLLRF